MTGYRVRRHRRPPPLLACVGDPAYGLDDLRCGLNRFANTHVVPDQPSHAGRAAGTHLRRDYDRAR